MKQGDKGEHVQKTIQQNLNFNMNNLDINNLPDLLTVREVAALLRVSPLTIKRWGKRGILIPIRLNERGDRRYRKEEILKRLV